jgi:hypothetical protein
LNVQVVVVFFVHGVLFLALVLFLGAAATAGAAVQPTRKNGGLRGHGTVADAMKTWYFGGGWVVRHVFGQERVVHVHASVVGIEIR